LFLGGRATCLLAADANDDSKVNIADPIWLVRFLFLGSRPPPLPYPDPGYDLLTPSPTLDCQQ
jgi:hypothetical protein